MIVEPPTSPPSRFEPTDHPTRESPLRVEPTATTAKPSPQIPTRNALAEAPDNGPPAKRRRSNRYAAVSVDKIEVVGSSLAAPAQEHDNPFEIGLLSETVGNEVEPVSTQAWDDLDAEDENDPLMVAEYVVEIFDYMKQLEVSRLYSWVIHHCLTTMV